MNVKTIKKILQSIGIPTLIGIVLTIIYVALMSNRFFFLVPYEAYDDALQFRIAQSLAAGDWLGNYDSLTLAKGITFPLWTALLHNLDVPMWFGNTFLYITACTVFIFALRSFLKSQWALLFVYSILLFNPMISARAYRDAIAPGLVLFVLAWSIGLFARYVASRKETKRLAHRKIMREVFIFSVIGCVSLPAWWHLREDSFWILPFILVIVGMIFLIAIYDILITKQNIRRTIIYIFLILLPFASLYATSQVISSINLINYNRYVVNDATSSDFLAAYGALTRIKDDSWQRTVPVSEKMREKAYKISPAFKELRSCLDGDIKCESLKYNYYQIKTADYEGGWFAWALREATKERGYYKDAESSRAFYSRLANEINLACDNKVLECQFPERASSTSPFRRELLPLITENTFEAAYFAATLENSGAPDITLMNNPGGYTQEHEAMGDFYNARYDSSEQNLGSKLKQKVQLFIFKIYQTVNIAFSLIAIMGLIVLSFVKKVWQKDGWLLLLCWGLILLIIVRLVIIAYIETTAFEAIRVLYLSSLYPILFAFQAIVISLVAIYISKYIKTRLRKT